MENECTSYNFRPFAIFEPKIIRVGRNLTKLRQKQFCLFFSVFVDIILQRDGRTVKTTMLLFIA